MANDYKLKEGYLARWNAETRTHIYLHREIAERMIGRPLRDGEMVLHINGNRLDNDESNLRVVERGFRRPKSWVTLECAYCGVSFDRRVSAPSRENVYCCPEHYQAWRKTSG